MKLFALDLPTTRAIVGTDRLYGWYVAPHDRPTKLRVKLNGEVYATLQHGALRADVRAAFPDVPQAKSMESGFFGDVPVPSHVAAGESVLLQIVDEAADADDVVIFEAPFDMTPAAPTEPRERSFDLQKIMQCGLCGAGLNWDDDKITCTACAAPFPRHRGVPHLFGPGDKALFRMTEATLTHPYGAGVLALLDEYKDGMILDFGAGNTPLDCLRPNVVNLEVQHYQYTDVVALTPRLPFADATFDCVISQAVFEHLPFPKETAREFLRVLKPGGKVYIDTAFLQPLHGDPSHFYNMTPHAISLVFSGFRQLDIGVSHHQRPSFGLRMQLESVIPYVDNPLWQNRLTDWLAYLNKNSDALDEALGERGRTKLAAGFYYVGQKV